MDPYDTDLTSYEQRAAVRRQIRKEKLESQSSVSDHLILNGDSPVNGDYSPVNGDTKLSHVLVEEITLPEMENGIIEQPCIVTVNGDGPCKRSSSSSEDDKFDDGDMCNGNRDSVESFSTPVENSLPSVKEAWVDMNNDTTHSDISELSLPDSLLAEMGSDGHSVNSVTTNSIVSEPVNVGITKQRSKSESPTSSLKRNTRKASAPNLGLSVSTEIKSVEDEDNTEDFSLRRSKYTPIRRKRNSISGSNPSKSISERFDDLGPLPKVLDRLEENVESEVKSPEPLNKPAHHVDVLDGPVNKPVDKPTKPVNAVKKPVSAPLHQAGTQPTTSDKTETKLTGKQRRRSVKGLFTRKSSTGTPPVVKTITEQTTEPAAKPVKVKKATRRAPLRGIVSRFSPKRDIPPSKTTNTINSGKNDVDNARKPPMMKHKSHSSSSLLKRQTDDRSSTKSDKYQARKNSSFAVTKEPLKSSNVEASFPSREASKSVDSLLSDGSTDILMAHSSHELCAYSSREDLLEGDIASSLPDVSTDQDDYSLADEISIQTQNSEKQDTSSLFTEDVSSRGPSPVILVTSPKDEGKTLEAVVDDDAKHVQLYKAKSMEVLSSTEPVATEVSVHTSTVPTSNLPNTVSVSTENLISTTSAEKKGIKVSTVKKCTSLDILAVSKQAPAAAKVTTISVTSRKAPTKTGLPPLASSVHKVEVKKENGPSPCGDSKVVAKLQAPVEKNAANDSRHAPTMTRQSSGRKISGAASPFQRTNSRSSVGRAASPFQRTNSRSSVGRAASPFQRTNSRSSVGRKKSMSTTQSSATANTGQGVKRTVSPLKRTTSPAKKTTTITIKSTKSAVTATPVKVSSNVTKSTNTTTSNSIRRISSPTKSSNSTANSGIRRVTSPTRSSLRRSSVQRTSGKKKSTTVTPTTAAKSTTPSPVPPKVSFMSLFDSEDGRRITRVSSDEVANNGSNNTDDVVHGRSTSEIVSTVSHTTGLSDIVENQLLTTSVEELDTGRVASAMSDTVTTNKKTVQQSPMRRISSVPVANDKSTTPKSQSSPVSHGSPQRKKSSTGVTRPINVLHDRSGLPQQHSDSSLKRPVSATTRRTSSTMRPSSSGTLPRTLSKTKSDSKLSGIATLPRTHKTTDSTAVDKRPARPHSAAVSRGGLQSTRSSNRKLSMVPTSSAGRFTRTSSARRSKSTVVRPDPSLLNSNEGTKAITDEVDGAVASTPAHNILRDVKPKNPDSQKKSNVPLRSSMRRTSTLSKSADGATLSKESRQSVTRSSRRTSSHTITTKPTQSSDRSTPSKKLSMDRRPSNSAVHSTPKNEPSLSMSDLDAVKSADRLQSSSHRRYVRPKLRQKPSLDHLKQLMGRDDITSDISPDVNSKKKNRVDPNTYSTYMGKKNLAASAMAGLASVENFAAVKLRKTANRDQGEVGVTSAGVSFSTPSISLIHIKGRRKVRSRLVNPTRASVNSEDVFVLVTPTELYEYIGAKANVIEKAKGAEIVQRIHQKKELGCKTATYHTIEEGKSSAKESAFWEILGGRKLSHGGADTVPSDELYEKTLPTSWVMYEFQGEKFVAVHEKQTGLPKKEILKSDKIFFYDCGHEAYVWIGRQSVMESRKLALQQARKIYDESCNTPDFAHMDSRSRPHSGRIRSKMTARKLSGSGFGGGGIKVKHCERPQWALFVRLNEGSETVMFKEKFADWPDESRIIKMKGHSTAEKMVEQVELKPCDISKMLIPQPLFQGLVLEGDNVHRGAGRLDPHSSTGTKVTTNSITKWLIKENTRVVIPQSEHNIFYSAEGYVIKWSYRLCTMRKLEGLSYNSPRRSAGSDLGASPQLAHKSSTPDCSPDKKSSSPGVSENDARYLESGGRDRVAYFFWQGDDSSTLEKGTTAYSTVELDEEGATQVRVVQGKEPAAFRSIWGGAMITLLQKSDVNPLEQPTNGNTRLYEVSGQLTNEAALLQLKIPDDTSTLCGCLRSRGCYVVHDVAGCKLFVWKGVKALNVLKHSAVTAAQKLQEKLPNLEIIYLAEGEESREFWMLLGGKCKYPSLVSDVKKYEFTPRLFELSSVTQQFLATEVLHPCRSSEILAFPFLQSDLYQASQPAIFLLDAHYEVYVWFGWWWKDDYEVANTVATTANSTTGSRVSRWIRDKQLALETAQQYAKACTKFRTIQVFVVYAGMEHEHFIQHFPFWMVSKEVQQLNCKESKPVPKRLYIEDELKKYKQKCYTLKELQQRPLPGEVDPTKMEVYLTDKEFELAFKKTRTEFQKLPQWKQTALKKEAGLF